MKEFRKGWPRDAATSRVSSAAFAMAAMLLGNHSADAAAVIVNPSFETGATFENTGWQSLQTFITGIPVIVSNGTAGFGNTPFGSRYIAMYNPEIGGGVYQTISGLMVGTSYELRFWGSTSQSNSGIYGAVSIGTGPSATLVALEKFFVMSSFGFADFSQWHEFVLPFTATATELTVSASLVGVGQGPVQFGEGAVDNFSIIEVPEPASLPLVGLIVFLLRRRRSTIPNP